MSSWRPGIDHIVGYGFYAPEGSTAGHWSVRPQMPFRANKIYVWANETPALIHGLRFSGEEQLLGPLHADLFDTCLSAREFLSVYGNLQNQESGDHRLLLAGLPFQPHLSLGNGILFPTLPVGDRFEVVWTGSLSAFFVCGRELVADARPPFNPFQESSPS